MKIWVLNYLLAQKFQPTEPTLAIRIFDPNADAEKDGNSPARKLVDSSLWVAQLEYCFADIDLTLYEEESPETFHRLQRDERCFDSLMAKRLIADVTKHLSAVQHIMVHCNAGISRSVAVAVGLYQRLKPQHPEWEWEWARGRTKGLIKEESFR